MSVWSGILMQSSVACFSLQRMCWENLHSPATLSPQHQKIIKWQFWLSVNYLRHSFKQTSAPLLFPKHGDLQLFCLFCNSFWHLKSIYQKLNRLGIQSENNTCTLTAGLAVNLRKITANVCLILINMQKITRESQMLNWAAAHPLPTVRVTL